MSKTESVSIINGELAAAVSATDRGVLYGDGVFRTMVRRRGALHQFNRHYEKLSADAAKIGLRNAPATSWLADIAALPQKDGVLRMTLTRGEGGRGYASPREHMPTRIVSWHAEGVPTACYAQTGIAACFCELRLARQPALAGIKHLNRLENVLARREFQTSARYQEGLLLDSHDCVIEGTSTNLFIVKDRMLTTPDLYYCGVAGVQRDRVLAFARSEMRKVSVRPVTADELLAADLIFLTNSVIGVWQIVELEERVWPSDPWVARLRTFLESVD